MAEFGHFEGGLEGFMKFIKENTLEDIGDNKKWEPVGPMPEDFVKRMDEQKATEIKLKHNLRKMEANSRLLWIEIEERFGLMGDSLKLGHDNILYKRK